jgi:hypothetical protein
MKILAIDPGVTSGYCLAQVASPAIALKPFQMVDDVDDIWDRLALLEPRYIICENFEFRQRSRAGLNLFPMQAIGVIRLYELKASHQTSVTLQKASEGKSYFTDAQLKRLGVYKRGLPHGMDATRHLIHWFTFGSGYQFVQKNDQKYILI